MATDNHRYTAVLFPDPQEHFGHPRWPTDTDLDGPTTDTAPSPVAATITDDPLETDDPFEDDEASAGGVVTGAAGEFAPHLPVSHVRETAVAPARVPQWVGAHVPADRLVMDEPNRLFRRSRPAAPSTSGSGVDASPKTMPAVPHRRRPIPAGWIAAGVLAAVSLIAAGVVVIGGDENPTTTAAATPQPTQPQATQPAATRVPTTPVPVPVPWCTTAATADATTTAAAGNRESAIGVIAAFEHAYYVQRSGAAVAALMTSPAPADRIQAVIDRTPAGTEHCATIAATDLPDVHAVALALRTPSGSTSAITSTITTARTTDGSFAIADVEEVR